MLSRSNNYFEVYNMCNHNKPKDRSIELALYTKDKNKHF